MIYFLCIEPICSIVTHNYYPEEKVKQMFLFFVIPCSYLFIQEINDSDFINIEFVFVGLKNKCIAFPPFHNVEEFNIFRHIFIFCQFPLTVKKYVFKYNCSEILKQATLLYFYIFLYFSFQPTRPCGHFHCIYFFNHAYH